MGESKNKKLPFDDTNIDKDFEKIINNAKDKKYEKVEDNFFDYLDKIKKENKDTKNK